MIFGGCEFIYSEGNNSKIGVSWNGGCPHENLAWAEWFFSLPCEVSDVNGWPSPRGR
jgi:hypothetical protein